MSRSKTTARRPKSKPKGKQPLPVAPIPREQAQATAGALMQVAQMLAGMAKELHDGATVEREHEISGVTWRTFGAIFEWSDVRVKRMFIVKSIALAVHFELKTSAALRTTVAWAFAQQPSENAIQEALEAWARAGAPRASGKAPLQWKAMAALISEAGLGSVSPESLRVDWQRWQQMRL